YLPILKSKMAATNNLGAYCRFICRFDLALKYFKEARSCVDQRFFHRMFERFSIYSNLGVVYATLKDFIEAKIYQRLALYIQEASEAKHRNTALASYNLGETLFRLGEYDEAMKLFDATEKIAKNICGSFHCLCGEAYKGRGLIFFERALKAYRQDKKKILNQSIEYHKKALEIFQRDLGEDSDELITSLCNLGVSSAFVDFQSSETYFNLAKAKILLKDPERKRVRYWKDFYSQKALACKEANRIEEARKYYYLSLDTWMKHLEPLSEAAKKQCRFETAFRLNNYEMILKHLAKLAPNRKKAYELEFALSLNFCKTHKLVFQDKDSDETKN
ncbi:MAG: tetratricopeptide repeat protein, partial [Parachlamydiaceae bacterium]